MYDTDHPKLKLATGSDTEALIYRVEAAFDVELEPEKINRMNTVDDLFAAIQEKFDPSLGEGCVSQAAFYRVRRVLREHYGAAREAVRPDSRMLEFAPALRPLKTRRRQWKALSERLQCHLPELGLSKIESTLLGFIAVACLASFIWLGCLIPLSQWHIYLFFGAIIFTAMVVKALLAMLSRFAPSRFVNFPTGCDTVAGLVGAIRGRNFGALAREQGLLNQCEAWKLLVEIIADECGVKPEEVKPEAHLVEDLAID